MKMRTYISFHFKYITIPRYVNIYETFTGCRMKFEDFDVWRRAAR